MSHKKKTEDTSEEQFTEAMNKALEEVPDAAAAEPVPEETESGKQRISSTGEEVELSEEEFRKLKLLS